MSKEQAEGSQSDPRSTEELIRLALITDDEDGYNDLLAILYDRGDDEVLNSALELCSDDDADSRIVGAHILCQLKVSDPSRHKKITDTLLKLLKDDDTSVVASAAKSFGFREDSASIKPLIELTRHTEPFLRLAAIYGLYMLSEDEEVFSTIMRLTADPDRDVRERATFSLAVAESNRPDAIQALRDRVNDEDGEIRGDALIGLARLKEPDVLDLVLKELSSSLERDEVWDDTLDAAMEVADARLLPILKKIKDEGIESSWLDSAIKVCSRSNQYPEEYQFCE